MKKEREWVSLRWNCVYNISKTMKLVETCIGSYKVLFHTIAHNHMPHNWILWLVYEIVKWNFALEDLVSFVNSNVLRWYGTMESCNEILHNLQACMMPSFSPWSLHACKHHHKHFFLISSTTFSRPWNGVRVGSMSSTAQLIADLFFIRDIGLIMYECYTIKQLVIPKKIGSVISSKICYR